MLSNHLRAGQPARDLRLPLHSEAVGRVDEGEPGLYLAGVRSGWEQAFRAPPLDSATLLGPDLSPPTFFYVGAPHRGGFTLKYLAPSPTIPLKKGQLTSGA